MQKKYLYYAFPAILVLFTGGMLHLLGVAPGAQAPLILPEQVVSGRDYYVTVALAELSETDAANSRWDSLSESGPDVLVEIYWKGNRIYRSTTKSDTFVAKWSNAELNIRAMALSGERTSMDDVIRAARINVKPEEEIEIRVYDDDLVSNTLAGTKRLLMTELVLGDKTYVEVTPQLKRLTLRVTDMSQAVDPLG